MLSLIKRMDLGLNAAVVVLITAGLISLLSTSPGLFYKQLLWVGIALVFFILISYLDLRSFIKSGGAIFILYLFILLILLLMLFFAPEIKGNRAWIVLGPFQVQPAEIAKIIIILFLAQFFAKRHTRIAFWGTLISSFALVFPLIFLIVLQPDFGSAAVLFLIWLGFVLFSGLPIKRVFVIVLVLLLGLIIMWNFVLKDYQKARIIGVFNPNFDPLGVNYGVIQSKIAIGSGGFFGKGFGSGTQVQLGFLPEAQTDFIFAAIAEEGGLVAVLLIVLTFLFMIFRILKVGIVSYDNTLKFISIGAAFLFFIQFVLNVGSNLGLVPVIGVTFPFVSYGGSSMFANLLLIGIIQSFYVRRT